MDIISYKKAVEALQKSEQAFNEATESLQQSQQAYDRATESLNEVAKAYINGSGDVLANGIYTQATNLYLGTDSWVRVTDQNGYNGGSPNYMPIIASEFRIPSASGEFIMTSERFKTGHELIDMNGGTTVTYRVDFSVPFNGEPTVTANYGTTVPEKMTPIGITDVSSSGFTLHVQRNNDTATWVDWIAIYI